MKNAVLSVLILLCAAYSAKSQSLKEANSLYEEFRYAEAIKAYENILRKDKDNTTAIINIAHAYRQTSNTAKAEYWYKKAIRRDKDPLLQFYLAQALMSNSKYAEALTAFEAFKDAMPYDSRGWRFVESCKKIQELMRDSSMYRIENFSGNSSDSDFGTAFFKNGIVFASGRSQNLLEKKDGWTGEAYVSMFYAEKKGYSWGKPVSLEGMTKSDYHEGPAVFTRDGKKMYFTRNVSKGKKGDVVNLKVFEVTWNNGKWDYEKELPFNSNEYSVGHPAISKDGKILYFTSDKPGGYGGKDIYFSEFKAGRWQSPQNMGRDVNTEGDEMFPSVGEDDILYFASNGLGGFGGLDIFRATPKNAYDWEVVNVGYPINGPRDDFGLILTYDMRSGYFSSNRAGGKGNDDIYVLSINEIKAHQLVSLKPADMVENNIAMAPPVSKPTPKPTPTPKPSTRIHAPAPQTQKAIASSPTAAPSYDQPAPQISNIVKPSAVSPSSDMKNVIIGVILNEITKEPIANAEIVLVNQTKRTEKKYRTKEDGNFYFSADADAVYEIYQSNAKNAHARKSVVLSADNDPINYVLLEGSGGSRGYTIGIDNSTYPSSSRGGELNNNRSNPTVIDTDTKQTYSYNNDKAANRLSFKVQIGAFSSPQTVNLDLLGDLKDQVKVEHTPNKELTRYVVGDFSTYDEAVKYQQILANKGIRNPFIAPYLNSKRLEMTAENALKSYYKNNNMY